MTSIVSDISVGRQGASAGGRRRNRKDRGRPLVRMPRPRGTVLALTVGLVVTMTVAHAPPADAHRHRALSAHLVGTPQIFCPDGPSGLFCSIEGRVRIVNQRAPGTGRILICVGIDVMDGRGRSLSIEPPSTGGQAVAALGPGRYQVTAYRTTFRRPLQAKRPVITHVHKHVVHGGQQC